MKKLCLLLSLLAIAFLFLPHEAIAASRNTQLHWYGHSAFKITTPAGRVLLIDPWLNNPTNKTAKADLAELNRVDLILVTHGHFDHVGDAIEIAKKTKARLVSTFDLGGAMVRYEGYPKDLVSYDTQGNFGGEISLLDGEVAITFIPAVHSSTVAVQTAEDKTEESYSAGNPSGFLVSVRNGPTIYHTGDTDLFSDMALIPRFHKVTVMLACIGDHFTMGSERAAQAVKLVQPAIVVPMHFGTFPALNGTTDTFAKAFKRQKVKSQLKIMQVGESLKL